MRLKRHNNSPQWWEIPLSLLCEITKFEPHKMKRNFGSSVSHENLHCAPVQREEIGRLLVGDPFEGDARFWNPQFFEPPPLNITLNLEQTLNKISVTSIGLLVRVEWRIFGIFELRVGRCASLDTYLIPMLMTRRVSANIWILLPAKIR